MNNVFAACSEECAGVSERSLEELEIIVLQPRQDIKTRGFDATFQNVSVTSNSLYLFSLTYTVA